MKKSKWMLGAAAMLALSVALAGCGGGDKKADNKAGGVKGDLMVYTSIYPDIIDNMCKPNVAKAFPDMKHRDYLEVVQELKNKMRDGK